MPFEGEPKIKPERFIPPELANDLRDPGLENIPNKIFTPEEMEEIVNSAMAVLISLEKEKRNPYHNADHARDVLSRTRMLVEGFKTSVEDKQAMELAALFHDYGHLGRIDEPGANEEFSATFTDKFAKAKGLSLGQRELISRLIIATTVKKPGVGPENELENLFAIADGVAWVAEPEKWFKNRALLLKEALLANPRKLPKDTRTWLSGQINWARRHLPKGAEEIPFKGTEKTWGDLLKEKELICDALNDSVHPRQSRWLDEWDRLKGDLSIHPILIID